MAHYFYHPSTTFKLGYAIDPRSPFDDKTRSGYFQWLTNENDIIEDISDNVGGEILVDIEGINKRSELYNKLSLDLNINAKFALTKFGSSLHWEKEMTFTETSLVYVVSAKKIYNPETFPNNKYVALSEKGKQALENHCKNKRILDLQRTSGTEIVTRIIKGNMISLVYIFNFLAR